MSTRLMAECWPLQMSPAQKAVLISLADMANDDGVCWPSVSRLTERTCLSERTVQAAIKWLESAFVIERFDRSGQSSVYRLTPAAYAPPQEMRGAGDAPPPAAAAPPPPQMPHPTPAAAAPRNVIEPSIEPSRTLQQQACTNSPRLQTLDEWVPSDETRANLTQMLGVPERFIDESLAEFRTYWRDRGGTPISWNAKFIQSCNRNWQRNGHTWRQAHETTGNPGKPRTAAEHRIAVDAATFDYNRATNF